jgi:hypothetical protein
LIGDELRRCVIDQQDIDQRSPLSFVIAFTHAGTAFPASASP